MAQPGWDTMPHLGYNLSVFALAVCFFSALESLEFKRWVKHMSKRNCLFTIVFSFPSCPPFPLSIPAPCHQLCADNSLALGTSPRFLFQVTSSILPLNPAMAAFLHQEDNKYIKPVKVALFWLERGAPLPGEITSHRDVWLSPLLTALQQGVIGVQLRGAGS